MQERGGGWDLLRVFKDGTDMREMPGERDDNVVFSLIFCEIAWTVPLFFCKIEEKFPHFL